jgi:SAM-dependent methyltransferase
MAAESLGKDRFEQAYEGKAPWDIGRPQPVLREVAEGVSGSILDAGCGTGENALFFAERGHQVVGIDFLEKPIAKAKAKAQSRGLTVTFLVIDALRLDAIPDHFDAVIDCGLFHVFSDEDRLRYVAGLASVMNPGGKLFLLCFSDREPPGDGPRRVSQREIRESFAESWDIETITEARFAIRSDLEDRHFSEGGPKAWFSVIRSA